MSTNDTEEKPVLISIDYHSADDDEIITHHDITLTRLEMRALTVWFAKQSPGKMPSENAMSGANRLYALFSKADNAIDDLYTERCQIGSGS